jgi:SAM-dependent methyltransferase
MTALCQIAARLNCDKCSQVGHNYTPVYAELIARDISSLLEIGIGAPHIMSHVPGYAPGAGLRMWAEWCPWAKIYGVDIDPACAHVSGDRIHIQIADATTQHVFPGVPRFDVIIDDGSHQLHDQLAALQRLHSRLAPGGVYVVEDVRQWGELLALGEKLGLAGDVLEWPENPMTGDNRLVVFVSNPRSEPCGQSAEKSNGPCEK